MLNSVTLESVLIIIFFACWIYTRVKSIDTQNKIEEELEKWNMEE